jgi:septal ring factor EnvC (AmiA/AmiB activator)
MMAFMAQVWWIRHNDDQKGWHVQYGQRGWNLFYEQRERNVKLEEANMSLNTRIAELENELAMLKSERSGHRGTVHNLCQQLNDLEEEKGKNDWI